MKDQPVHLVVIGLGYVGLPLVELFARNGFHVKGFDIDMTKVDALNSGQSYIGHIGSERVASMIASAVASSVKISQMLFCG